MTKQELITAISEMDATYAEYKDAAFAYPVRPHSHLWNKFIEQRTAIETDQKAPLHLVRISLFTSDQQAFMMQFTHCT